MCRVLRMAWHWTAASSTPATPGGVDDVALVAIRIPEVLASRAGGNEVIAHDCGLVGNPSHTGIDDVEREYPEALRTRLLLYHYGSEADGTALVSLGYRIAIPGERVALPAPPEPRADAG